MPNLRELRDALLTAYNLGAIDDVEFALLYDLNTSKTPEIPYWQYDPFSLENMHKDECKAEFRIEKENLHDLVEALQLEDEQFMYNRLKVDTIEAICVLLKRLAYPCRYLHVVPRFARPVAEICVINNHMMNLIYDQWVFLLTDLNRQQLFPENLQRYANAVYARGAPLQNCRGFVDGTVRPIFRPGHDQRVVYNGHKRVHAIKFQSVTTPDGLVALLHGPYEAKRHDSGILRESGLLQHHERHSVSPHGQVMCIYGDPAYPIRQLLQAPFRNAVLTEEQQL